MVELATLSQQVDILRTKTRSGADAVIFFDAASDSYPYLGMYFNNEEWIPTRWTRSGKFSEDGISGLDLVNNDEKEAA